MRNHPTDWKSDDCPSQENLPHCCWPNRAGYSCNHQYDIYEPTNSVRIEQSSNEPAGKKRKRNQDDGKQSQVFSTGCIIEFNQEIAPRALRRM